MPDQYYNDWVNSYSNYLITIYREIVPNYYTGNNISFDDFCKFIYNHSSGFITQYT